MSFYSRKRRFSVPLTAIPADAGIMQNVSPGSLTPDQFHYEHARNVSVRTAIRSPIDAASPCPELESRKRTGRPFMVAALREPLMTRGASRRSHRIGQYGRRDFSPARYFAGEGLCDCSAHEQVSERTRQPRPAEGRPAVRMMGCRAGGLLAAAVMAASSVAGYTLMRRAPPADKLSRYFELNGR